MRLVQFLANTESILNTKYEPKFSVLPYILLRMEKNSIPYSPEILRVTSYHETCAEAVTCVFPSALLFKEVAPVFQKKYRASEFKRNSRLRQIFFFKETKQFFLFIYFLQWILSYIEMKQPWVYMCSPSRSPLPPPSPPDPSRSSQCTRSERLSHASNLGW